MPRKYVRKTTKVESDVLCDAMIKIKLLKQSVKSVAAFHQIKERNLFYLSKNFNEWMGDDKDVTENKVKDFLKSQKRGGGHATVSLNNFNFLITFILNIFFLILQIFTPEQEKALMDYVLKVSKMCYGITIRELKTMAFEFAVKMKIKHPKIWDKNKIAGRDWYECFMSRHPRLTFRTPEQISMARVKSFNRENVDSFFNNLSNVLGEHDYDPDRIWNMDETGFPTVPTKVQKLLAEVGTSRVGQMQSQERGTNVTCALAVNAAGQKIPPFLLFPSKNHLEKFTILARKDTAAHSNSSGWMQQKEFFKFMEHFIKHAHARKGSPTLLLLDNHTSHLSVKAIDLAIENDITMLSFPPHCTHKMQPVDNGVFKQVKALYMQKHAAWMKSNGSKLFELHHAPPLIEQSCDEGATPRNIIKSFEKTGVYPFNPHVFQDDDFVAAEMMERARITAEQLEEGQITAEDRRNIIFEEEIPTASFETVSTSESVLSSVASVGPVQFSVPRKKSNRGPRPMKSAIYTTQETRDTLKEKSDKREANKKKKEVAKAKSPAKSPKGRAKGIKTTPVKKGRPARKPKKKVSPPDTSSSSDDDMCGICGDALPKRLDRNNSIKCNTCKKDFHARCAKFSNSYFTCRDCDTDLDTDLDD